MFQLSSESQPSDSDVFISNSLYVNQLITGGITTLGDDITTRNLEVTGFSTFHGNECPWQRGIWGLQTH